MQPGPSPEPQPHDQLPPKWKELQKEEAKLWRISLLFVALLAAALAADSWKNFLDLSRRLQAIPVGTFVIAVLFAVFVATRRREIGELRARLESLQKTVSVTPSERRVAELAEILARSQRKNRELIDSFRDLMMAVSLDGTIQTTNRAVSDLVQKPFAEVVGHHLQEFFSEPSEEQVGRILAEFRQRGSWSGISKVRLRASDEVRHLDLLVYPILKDGNIVAASILAHDITTERDRESRFTELFETLQEGVYFTTPEGKLLDCNQALVRMLGYDSKEEILNIPVPAFYQDTRDRSSLLNSLEQNHAVRRELRLKRRDGTPVFCLNTGRAATDGAGRVVRYQGALVDVTEQRQIEARLQLEEEFRRRLVDSFPDLILSLDREGRYTFVSPRVREVLGYEPEQFLGRLLSDKEAPAQSPELERVHREVISGRELFASAEYTVGHRDGSSRILRANLSPLFDAQGRMAGVVASVRDNTTLKHLESQLIHAERMAAMGQMIDGFAHELNNPLTAILGAAELLETRISDRGLLRHFELLKQQARRAAGIVQNLLFFSRTSPDGQAHLSLSELVQRTLQLHEHSLRVNNIAVDFLPEPDLPGVLGDPNQLMQVFLNLIINAQQAIRDVRQRGTLRVRLGQNSGTVWASFQDDGPGVSPEALPRIFDPFYTTKRPGRGTGLGLSVSLAIIKKFRGSIDVQPAPGGGSVFTVYLPMRETPARKPALVLQ